VPQWLIVAGKRQIKRRRNLQLRVEKLRRPSTFEDPFAAAYRMPMGDGQGANESWAEYLRRMTSRPGWSVARLARESGIHRATIFKWLAGKGGVNVSSVRAIAAALGDHPENALRAAGNIASREEELDPDLKIILRKLADPDVPGSEKAAIRAALRYLADLADKMEDRPGRVIHPKRRREAS